MATRLPAQAPLRLRPILLSLHVGDDTPWEFRVESNPPTPAPIPPDVLAALLTGPQPVLVATGSGDDVLAVYAPHDVNWELGWITGLLFEP